MKESPLFWIAISCLTAASITGLVVSRPAQSQTINFPSMTLCANPQQNGTINMTFGACGNTPPPVPTPVNGTCGPSNGGSFASAPTSGLCSSGTPGAVSGSGPWSWACGGSNGGSTFICTAQLTPVVTDPCSAFPPFAGRDIVNPMTAGNVFPGSYVIASGQTGTSVRFVADSATFPRGLELQLIDQKGQADNKEAVVSICPHSFTPVMQYCRAENIYAQGSIYTAFGTPIMYDDCVLPAGKTYYMNFRSADPTIDTVSTQFINYRR